MSTGGFSDDDLLAALLAEDGFELPDTHAPGAAPRAADAPVIALSAQQRLWMMERIHGARGEFNLGLAVRFGGATPDVAALQAALTALAQRHESLRARFEDADGEAARLVFDALDALPLAVHDVGPASMPQALQDAAARPFSLERGSLFRADLLRAHGEQVLLLGFHHAIIDLWSASLVLRELAALYAAQLGGAVADLPQPQRFGDYVAWLGDSARQQALPALTAYWRNRLAGLPPLLELPFAGPREAGQDRCGRIAVVLAPALAAELGRFAAACGTTPFTVVLAAFNAVLARFTGQDDLAVGVPVSNRHRPHTGGTVGFLVETLVLRTDLRADPGFAALVERVREACLEDFAHQDLPLQAVVQAVNPPRLPGVQPLYQAMLVFQALPALREAAGDVLLTGQAVPLPVARADLTLELDQGRDDGAIAGWLEYREGLVDEQVAQAIAIA
uniref:condensation domain-containing protein n=1 Tax=Delftia sp. ASV31 TaxID=2795113 RepID=UPI001E47834A